MDEKELDRTLRGIDPATTAGEWKRRREMLRGKFAQGSGRRDAGWGRLGACAAGLLLAAGSVVFYRDPQIPPGGTDFSNKAAAGWFQAASVWIGTPSRFADSAAMAVDPGAVLSRCRRQLEASVKRRLDRAVDEVKAGLGIASSSELQSF